MRHETLNNELSFTEKVAILNNRRSNLRTLPQVPFATISQSRKNETEDNMRIIENNADNTAHLNEFASIIKESLNVPINTIDPKSPPSEFMIGNDLSNLNSNQKTQVRPMLLNPSLTINNSNYFTSALRSENFVSNNNSVLINLSPATPVNINQQRFNTHNSSMLPNIPPNTNSEILSSMPHGSSLVGPGSAFGSSIQEYEMTQGTMTTN